MNKYEKALLKLTLSNDEATALKAINKLKEINPTYHLCPEWDYLAICDKHDEFKICNCFFDNTLPHS